MRIGTSRLPDHKNITPARNPSTVASEYFTVKFGNGTGDVNAQEIGRLYAGDWMFLPYSADTDTDITITPSVATSMTIEYMALYHS